MAHATISHSKMANKGIQWSALRAAATCWALGIASFHRENRMELSAVLTPVPEGGYVAYNPETGTTTQGETVEEALANLREATELYLEEFPLVVTGRPLLTSFHVAVHA
jgi:predicted RNase H-like HicB family nuclease